jgi:hypothetical protein
MRNVPLLLLPALALCLAGISATAAEGPGALPPPGAVDSYEMVTDDAESNRAFYRAIGYEFVPEAMVRENEADYAAGYCTRLAQRHKLDAQQARFLGLLYVAKWAIAPACYTLQPFTDDLAAKRCNLMRRPVLRNDPATRTLVCGPRRAEGETGAG